MKEVSERIVSLLSSAGRRGLPIDEIASKLDIGTKTIEESIKKLLKENRIKMEDTRYMLQQDAVGDEAEAGTVGDLNGCPCFHCGKLVRCGIRQPDSPVKCRDMINWMAASDTA